jgi:tetratricopeptide (TPR) repeat protein
MMRYTWALIFSMICAVLATGAEPLHRQIPFDELKLDETNNNAVLKVKPLDLLDRKVPAPGVRKGDLEIELMDRPGEKFTVPWANVVDVKLYEDRVLAEAEQFVAAGKFDDAQAAFRFLEAKHPRVARLGEAIENFLWLQIGGSFRAGKHDETLALLVELQRRNPNRAGLSNAYERTTSELVKARLAAKNYRGARGLLANLARRFPETGPAVAAPFHAQMQDQAKQFVTEAQAAAAEGRWSEAHALCSQALDVWPMVDGGAVLSQQIHEKYPVVTIGVIGSPAGFAPASFGSLNVLSDWHARRVSRLVATPLAELVDGEKGFVYRSPYGRLVQQSDARQYIVRLAAAEGAAPAMTAADLARRLDASGVPALSAIRARTLTDVLFDFRESQLRPAGWLRFGPQEQVAGNQGAVTSWGQFAAEAPAPDRQSFRRRPEVAAATTAPQIIFERKYPDVTLALAALRRGQISGLDRVPPWELARLRNVNELRVQSYAVPTVHVLVPNPQRPLLANRTFRRGLLTALDRESILKVGLLAEQQLPGCEVISGPFPKGSDRSPWGYSYNADVKPRAYEPALATWLLESGRLETSTSSATGPNPPLVLAYDDSPIAKIACQSIARQLARIGQPVTLQPVAAGKTAAEQIAAADLTYVELSVSEPVVEAWFVLGPNGLAGSCSPLMLEHFRALETAADIAAASARLQAIHELAATELPVIPLWQTTNYLVTHSSLQGVAEHPVSLYEDILQWQIAWQPPQE